MATVGKIGWTKIFHYMIAQYLGAFFGSAITFLIYRESLIKGNRNETFGVFSTLRRDDITLGTALIDQVGPNNCEDVFSFVCVSVCLYVVRNSGLDLIREIIFRYIFFPTLFELK